MRALTVSTILFISGLALTQSAVARAADDRFCEEAKELAQITSQVPQYVLSWQAETPAEVIPPLKFKPVNLLLSAKGLPVCVAVLVSEDGVAEDAAAYYPKRVALSKSERKELLANSFTPAKQGGLAVKSIVVMKSYMN